MSASRLGDALQDAAHGAIGAVRGVSRDPMPAKAPALLAKQVSLDAPLLLHGAGGPMPSLAKTPSLPAPGARLSPPLRVGLPAGGIHAILEANLAGALPGAGPGALATAWLAARLGTAGAAGLDAMIGEGQRQLRLGASPAPAQQCPGMGQLQAAGLRPRSPGQRLDGAARAAPAAPVQPKGEPDVHDLAGSLCSMKSAPRADLHFALEADAARSSMPNAAPLLSSLGPAASGRREALAGGEGLHMHAARADTEKAAGMASLVGLFKAGLQEPGSGWTDAPEELWKPCRLLKDDDSYIGLGAMAEKFLSSALDDAPHASPLAAGRTRLADAGLHSKGLATPLQKSSSLGKAHSSSDTWCRPGRRAGAVRSTGVPDASPDHSRVTAGDATHQQLGRRDESECSLRTFGSGGLEAPGFAPSFPRGALSALEGTRLAGIDISNPRGASLLASLLDKEIGGSKSRPRAGGMFLADAPTGDRSDSNGVADNIMGAASLGGQLGRAGSWKAMEGRGDEHQQLIAALKGHLVPGGLQPCGQNNRDGADMDRPGSGDEVAGRWGRAEGGCFGAESPHGMPPGHRASGALGKRKAEPGAPGRDGLSKTSSEDDREEAKEKERRERRMALNREAARRMRQRNADRLAELEHTVETLRKDEQEGARRLAQAERRVAELEEANERLESKLRRVAGDILTGDYAAQEVKDRIVAMVGDLVQDLTEHGKAESTGGNAASKEGVCRVAPHQGPNKDTNKTTQPDVTSHGLQGTVDVPASEQRAAPSETS